MFNILHMIFILNKSLRHANFECKSGTASFMSRIGINLSRWRRSVAGLGLMGWLLAASTGSGLSPVAAGGSETTNPILNPALHGMVLTTNGAPVANATVTINRMLAGRGAVYVSDVSHRG
jgi:hypothetical protein